MNNGIRDKIQNLQLSILQDYIEIKLKAFYGDGWISEIIAHCEGKVADNSCTKKDSYKSVVDEKKTKGAVMVTKKSFDVTLLNSLLRFDYPDKCCADPSDTNAKVFKNYIKNITDNKNKLASHISDLEDKYNINSLISDSLLNLRNFILYLERLGWDKENDTQRKFVVDYRKKIDALANEFSGSEKSPKVNISIAVKDSYDHFIPGYKLQLLNGNNEIVSKWTSGNELFSVLVDVGKYRIIMIDKPEEYKDILEKTFSASISESERPILIYTDRSISNEDLYVEAFDCLADLKQYSQGIALLEELEKANYLEAILLLSFLLEKAIYGEKDSTKAQDLLMFAGFQEDESSWAQKAETLKNKGKLKLSIPYYLASSMKSGNGEGYYQAAKILLLKVKNYLLCKECFKLAVSSGVKEAEKPYDYICKLGKEGYMNL